MRDRPSNDRMPTDVGQPRRGREGGRELQGQRDYGIKRNSDISVFCSTGKIRDLLANYCPDRMDITWIPESIASRDVDS